jgi:hypothetical protein
LARKGITPPARPLACSWSFSPSRSSGMSDKKHFIWMRPTTSLRSTAPAGRVGGSAHAPSIQTTPRLPTRGRDLLACPPAVTLPPCKARRAVPCPTALRSLPDQPAPHAPFWLSSALTDSTMSRKISLRLYLMPSRRQPTAPVTASVALLAAAASLARLDCARRRRGQGRRQEMPGERATQWWAARNDCQGGA